MSPHLRQKPIGINRTLGELQDEHSRSRGSLVDIIQYLRGWLCMPSHFGIYHSKFGFLWDKLCMIL
jgi:hypothetical protein